MEKRDQYKRSGLTCTVRLYKRNARLISWSILILHIYRQLRQLLSAQKEVESLSNELVVYWQVYTLEPTAEGVGRGVCVFL